MLDGFGRWRCPCRNLRLLSWRQNKQSKRAQRNSRARSNDAYGLDRETPQLFRGPKVLWRRWPLVRRGHDFAAPWFDRFRCRVGLRRDPGGERSCAFPDVRRLCLRFLCWSEELTEMSVLDWRWLGRLPRVRFGLIREQFGCGWSRLALLRRSE